MMRLAAEWDELCGEPWAARCRPVSLNEGHLVVEVKDGQTASLLRYQTADLVAILRGRLGAGVVGSVSFTVARKWGP